MITSDGDGILPAPSISVESRGKNGLRVCWKRSSKGVDPKYKLLLHVVNIVGTKFAKEINNSDIRLVLIFSHMCHRIIKDFIIYGLYSSICI